MIDEEILYRERRYAAEDAAAEHLSLRLSGQATAEDHEKFDQACVEDAELDLAWQRLTIIFDGSLNVKEDPRVVAMRTRARAARPAARRFNQFAAWKLSLDNWRPAAMAAALAVAVGFSVSNVTGLFDPKGGGDAIEVANWTPAQKSVLGKVEVLKLADGSSIKMGGNAVLRTAIGRDSRRVDLQQGEAYFDVARDEDARFTVEAGGVTVTALGTAFAVSKADGMVRVVLTKGSVRVDSKGENGLPTGTTTLVPGQQLLVTPTGFARSEVDTARATSWTSGMLDFQRKPLSAVVAEMNNYQSQKIILQDDALKHLPVTGIFPLGNPDALVQFLQEQGSVRVRQQTADQIVLDAR